jgi:starvation-inducible DNA-binding protein
MHNQDINPIGYGTGDQAVAECLADSMGNAVVLYFKAHGHHWNVMGPDFSQFHEFFSNIYEDVYSSIDPLAENMRKLGAMAPFRLTEFMALSSTEDANCGCSALMMCADLRAANEVMLASLNDCFAAANAANQQGIANFIAERIDMHQKWAWQLNAHLTSTDVSFM